MFVTVFVLQKYHATNLRRQVQIVSEACIRVKDNMERRGFQLPEDQISFHRLH
jgi:hypothetical protein